MQSHALTVKSMNAATSDHSSLPLYYVSTNDLSDSAQAQLNQIAAQSSNFGYGMGKALYKLSAHMSILNPFKEESSNAQTIQGTPKVPSAQVTQQLLSYYNDLKPESPFIQETHAKLSLAEEYLENRIIRNSTLGKEKLAAVFDLDETLLTSYFNFKKDSFADSLQLMDERIRKTDWSPIPPTVRFYNDLVDHGIKPFIISYRKSSEMNSVRDMRPSVIKNLDYIGLNLNSDDLFLPEGEELNLKSVSYKTNIRKKITEQGYRIIFNIGDQQSDLDGGYAELPILLPNKLYGPYSFTGAHAVISSSKNVPDHSVENSSIQRALTESNTFKKSTSSSLAKQGLFSPRASVCSIQNDNVDQNEIRQCPNKSHPLCKR